MNEQSKYFQETETSARTAKDNSKNFFKLRVKEKRKWTNIFCPCWYY